MCIENLLETEIKAIEKKVNYYNKSSYALKELANSLDQLSDTIRSPERVRKHLTELVNNADHLDKNTKDKMLEGIKNTDSFESVKTILQIGWKRKNLKKYRLFLRYFNSEIKRCNFYKF